MVTGQGQASRALQVGSRPCPAPLRGPTVLFTECPLVALGLPPPDCLGGSSVHTRVRALVCVRAQLWGSPEYGWPLSPCCGFSFSCARLRSLWPSGLGLVTLGL